MRLFKLVYVVCFFVCVSFAPVSYGANGIGCRGTIVKLGVHGTDKVILKLSDMNTVVQICHLNEIVGSAYPITPEQCKAAYSTLLTAYSLGKTISVTFDNVQNGTSCSTFSSWELATARWVSLDG